MNMLPTGVLPASVTPFLDSGVVDHVGVAHLISWFRAQGCAGIVLAGTNGEGPSLSAIEKRDLIKVAAPLAQGLPVVLGVATSSLNEAAWSCESARKAGASAALVMPPTYFREASEDGIACWFEQLLRETTLPVLLYNIPQRTGFTFSPDLVHRLCQHDGIAGIKDSSGNAENLVSFSQAAAGKYRYVGDERLLLDALAAGWSGTISGAANILAGWLAPIVSEWEEARTSAETKFAYIKPALEALKASPQPVANKWLLQKQGVIESAAGRLPLFTLPESDGEALWELLGKFLPAD